MDSTKQETAEANNAPVDEQQSDHKIEKETTPSHEDVDRGDTDVEAPREGVEQHPRMTFKRFMAIFSLGCLLAAAQIPIYLLGGALCTVPSLRGKA